MTCGGVGVGPPPTIRTLRLAPTPALHAGSDTCGQFLEVRSGQINADSVALEPFQVHFTGGNRTLRGLETPFLNFWVARLLKLEPKLQTQYSFYSFRK